MRASYVRDLRQQLLSTLSDAILTNIHSSLVSLLFLSKVTLLCDLFMSLTIGHIDAGDCWAYFKLVAKNC